MLLELLLACNDGYSPFCLLKRCCRLVSCRWSCRLSSSCGFQCWSGRVGFQCRVSVFELFLVFHSFLPSTVPEPLAKQGLTVKDVNNWSGAGSSRGVASPESCPKASSHA